MKKKGYLRPTNQKKQTSSNGIALLQFMDLPGRELFRGTTGKEE
ncbi:hypothetical protein [Brunnivagina elsteri]|nr:hypothetical protein [Calothrix elsteri]